MAAAAAAAARSGSSAAAVDRGVVRVTASEIMSAEALPAIFAGFRAHHPGIAIELAVTNRNQDLARGDADIAVRMIRPTQSGLVARRIGSTRISALCSSRLSGPLRRAALARRPAAALRHRLRP